MTTARARTWPPIVVAALAAVIVATLGITATDLGGWYQSLAMPAWKPPDWLFGPAWTLIFATTAMSGVIAWRAAADRPTRERVFALFAINACLNLLWSTLFFSVQRPDWALFEVILLWLSIVALLLTLLRVSKTASALLAPYLVWVSFAALLNLAVVRLNAPF